MPELRKVQRGLAPVKNDVISFPLIETWIALCVWIGGSLWLDTLLLF